MKPLLSSWQFWAILSATFAALTAISAKVGVTDISSNLATFIRTIVVLVMLAALLSLFEEWHEIRSVSLRSYVFLSLSGLATGASWICYFRALKLGEASRVAPVDKLSVVLVAIFGVFLLGERLSTKHWLGIALIAVGAALVAARV